MPSIKLRCIVSSLAFVAMTSTVSGQQQACCASGAAGGGDVGAITESRTHLVFTDKAGKKLGEATRVLRETLAVDRDSLLYRSADGDPLVLEEVLSYATRSTENSIRNVKGDARVTVRYKMPFTGRTRDEVLAEARQHPELWGTNSEQAEIITNGGSFRISDDEFTAPAELRKKLRQVIPFDLLETIERTTSTLFSTEAAMILRLQIVDLVVYRSQCGAEPATVTQSVPDCDFDKQFGFPCSDKQLARVRQARQDNSTGSY